MLAPNIDRHLAAVLLLAGVGPLGCSNGTSSPNPAVTVDAGQGDEPDVGAGIPPALGCATIDDTLRRNGCTNDGCHGNASVAGLDLLSDGVATRLVGVASVTDACRGEPLIDPADREASLLLRLVDPVRYATTNSCSVLMPFGSSDGVSAEDVACFEDWIDALIATVDAPDDDPAPFAPASLESILAKVKTLATGLAVTDEDRAAAVQPGGLESLLTLWVETPEFAEKMQDFLLVALHQRIQGLIGLQVATRDIGPLSGNFEASFVRTAWRLIEDGEPFHRVATTRRWAVTTAILSALRFTDQLNTRGGEFGRVRFLPGDYEDWRFVQLNQVDPSTQGLVDFDDLEALRAIGTDGGEAIDLINPRVGYFTTPAFFANSETNEDNQFRVTVNQALIVGLGRDLQQTDTTPQPSAAGFDGEHAAEDTCRSCHRLLDPMRLHFQRYYGVFYRQAPEPSLEPPSFAFLGQTNDGGTLDDFGRAIAEHARFPTAWVQRLCFYANSQGCNESDPEFARVVTAFVNSDYDFKTLVIQLLSSPLVTGAALTQTFEDQRFIVSITRRSQLCQLLDARLGTTDVCESEAVQPVIGLIPNDTFSRGAIEPIQPATSGGFHFAGAEQVCGRLSSVVVGNGSRFEPVNSKAALDEMVEGLMGLSPTHPRYDDARTRLGAHFDDAINDAGATEEEALASAFTLACLSPDVMGLGL